MTFAVFGVGCGAMLALASHAYAVPERMVVPLDPIAVAAAPLPGPNVLYLNNCKPSGCVVGPGVDDSRNNRSSIIQTQHVLSPFNGSDAVWNEMVACVRENYAPFNISVVTSNPGNVPHYEVIVAGLSNELGLGSGVAGIAPHSCGVIPNGISFTFGNLTPTDALLMCWTASQESAHLFGLPHTMVATDAMTYIGDPARKYFVDQTGCVGTQGCCQPAIECRCGPTITNSYQRLMSVLGSPPPSVSIVTPMANEVVASGFTIRIDAADPQGVTKVEIFVDGAVAASLTAPPFELTADAALKLGPHTISARAHDATGTVQATPTITVVRADPPEPDPDPEPEPDPPPADSGCSSTGAAGLGSLALLIALIGSRRRSRRN